MVMATPDVAALQATIAELKAELSRARVEAEVFRALYEREAADVDQLLAPHATQALASTRRHLRVVVGRHAGDPTRAGRP